MRVHSSMIKALHASRLSGLPVMVLVSVIAMERMQLPEDPDKFPRVQFRFKDLCGGPQGDGLEFPSVPIESEALQMQALSALHSGERMVAVGTFVPYGRPPRGAEHPEPHFELLELNPLRSRSDALGLEAGEVAELDATLDRLWQRPGAAYDHLIKESLAIGGYVPVFPLRFQRALRLVALQAVSAGQMGPSTNPRLSLSFSSAPGKGKSVLSHLAKTLSAGAVVSQSDTLSQAGLVAKVQAKAGGGWSSHPGLLPWCSGSTVVLEDYQNVPSRHKADVNAALMSCTEAGLAVTTKAARSEYAARTAVLLNSNRQSQSKTGAKVPVGVAARMADMNLTGALFSRIDVIADLESGDDPAAAGLEMLAAQAKAEPAEVRDERTRLLQALVARMQDRIPSVGLLEVQPEMRQAYLDLVQVARHVCAEAEGDPGGSTPFDPDILFRRMANTLRKLVGALARINGRSEAAAEDVEEAWELLSPKLEVVRWLGSRDSAVVPLGGREAMLAEARQGADERYIRLLMRFGGYKMRPADLAAEAGMELKQLSRELLRRGHRPVDGYLVLPTVEQYQAQERLRQIQQEEAAEREAALDRAAAERAVADEDGEPGQAAAAEDGPEQAAEQGPGQAAAEDGPALEAEEESGEDSQVVLVDLPVEEWHGGRTEVDPEVQQVLEGLKPKEEPKLGLVKVPLRLGGVLDALGRLDEEGQGVVANTLELLAKGTRRTAEQARWDAEIMKAAFMEESRVRYTGPVMGPPLGLRDLLDWLAQPADAGERGVRALSLWWEAGLPGLGDRAKLLAMMGRVGERVKEVALAVSEELERQYWEEEAARGPTWMEAGPGLGDGTPPRSWAGPG